MEKTTTLNLRVNPTVKEKGACENLSVNNVKKGLL